MGEYIEDEVGRRGMGRRVLFSNVFCLQRSGPTCDCVGGSGRGGKGERKGKGKERSRKTGDCIKRRRRRRKDEKREKDI